jgi:hypothetical protein
VAAGPPPLAQGSSISVDGDAYTVDVVDRTQTRVAAMTVGAMQQLWLTAALIDASDYQQLATYARTAARNAALTAASGATVVASRWLEGAAEGRGKRVVAVPEHRVRSLIDTAAVNLLERSRYVGRGRDAEGWFAVVVCDSRDHSPENISHAWGVARDMTCPAAVRTAWSRASSIGENPCRLIQACRYAPNSRDRGVMCVDGPLPDERRTGPNPFFDQAASNLCNTLNTGPQSGNWRPATS